jgi:hypothetical protein
MIALVGAAAAPAGAAEHAGQALCTDGATSVAGLTVEGDAWVEGTACDLTDVVVTGGLVVSGDRVVTLERVTVGGDLAAAGTVTILGSTVQGGVDASAQALVVQGSHVWHSIRGRAEALSVQGSTVDGAVNVFGDTAVLTGSDVRGWTNVLAASSADLRWSTFGRGVTSKGTGSFTLCGSDVATDVAVRGAQAAVTFGAEPCTTDAPPAGSARDGLTGDERDAVHVGGWLVLEYDAAPVTLRATTVGGNLSCAGNTGAIDHAGAAVAGQSTGQCR